jgi:hypothetical protein
MISGGRTPGSQLTCSKGGWAPDLLGAFLYRVPATYAYQWQRNGVDVPGATLSTYTALSTGSYTCLVTAGNAAGSTPSAPSARHIVATLSAVKITSPAELFQLASKITVSYSATDSAGAAAVTYDVQYERSSWDGGFGSWSALATGTSATSKSITGSAGHEYCFRIRAHDTAGNSTAWVMRCTVLPLDDRALTEATTGWTRTSSTGTYHSTLTTTSSAVAKLRLAGVHTDRLALLVTECPSCGRIGVYLDGTLWATVKTYASSSRTEVIVVIAPFQLRTTTITLRAVDANKEVLIDGLGVART